MHPVDDMTIFTRVIERRSLSAAGRELRLSSAVVSARMSKLEQRLGVRLLNRSRRTTTPTEEGQLYYDHCRKMLAETHSFEQILSGRAATPAGSLRLSAPSRMGRLWIAPLLPEFRRKHPEISIRLQLTDRVVDLADEEVDIAIRRGPLAPSALIARRIAPDFRAACAAPAYFAANGAPETPADLRQHECLLLRFPGSKRYQWRFDMGEDEENIAVSGKLDSNSSDALVDWAVAGEGLVMKSVWDLSAELESGALVPCLTRYSPRRLGIHALTVAGSSDSPKIKACVDFLAAALSAAPPAKLAVAMAGEAARR